MNALSKSSTNKLHSPKTCPLSACWPSYHPVAACCAEHCCDVPTFDTMTESSKRELCVDAEPWWGWEGLFLPAVNVVRRAAVPRYLPISSLSAARSKHLSALFPDSHEYSVFNVFIAKFLSAPTPTPKTHKRYKWDKIVQYIQAIENNLSRLIFLDSTELHNQCLLLAILWSMLLLLCGCQRQTDQWFLHLLSSGCLWIN